MTIIDFAEAVEISMNLEENSNTLDKKREVELLGRWFALIELIPFQKLHR